MGLAADTLLAARLRAGLTQRELAARAGTTQAAVNRWERGRHEPSLAALANAVRACGYDLRLSLAEPDPHDEALARLVVQTTPTERLDASRAWSRLRDAAHRIGP